MTDITQRQPAGTPVWIEHAANDPVGAKTFYQAVTGWQVDDSGPEFGHYGMASVDGRMAAGLGAAQPGLPSAWTLYVEVDDVSASAAKAAELGGQVVVPATAVPTVGEFAVVTDPTGAAVGLWRSDPFTGFGAQAEVGFACWHELVTSDPEASKAFYAALFGWVFEAMDTEDEGYVGARLATSEFFAGLTPLAADSALPRSYWKSYVQVEDADKAAEAVRSGGGRVVHEPYDSPYGRMFVALDPEGVPFAVLAG